MNMHSPPKRLAALLVAAVATGTLLTGCARGASDPIQSTADDWMRAVLDRNEEKVEELMAGCEEFDINFSPLAGDNLLRELPDEVSWTSEVNPDGPTKWLDNKWSERLDKDDAAKLKDSDARMNFVDYTINEDAEKLVRVGVVSLPAEDIMCVHSAYEPLR